MILSMFTRSARAPSISISLLLILQLCRGVAGADFEVCINKFTQGNSSLGGVDIQGNPVANASLAVGLTYETCKALCGSDNESFVWRLFSQQFTAWLLPWLALISQLPYGADDREGNVEAMTMTVGSPILAAYSPALAVNSNRWIIKRLKQSNHPNGSLAAKALGGLRDVQFKLPDQRVLSELSTNNEWWKNLATDLTRGEHEWTVAAIVSMVYVAIAYVFTWVGTLQGDLSAQIFATGQAVGSIWLALLPIVICYLQLSPMPNIDQIRRAVRATNRIPHRASSSEHSQSAQTTTPVQTSISGASVQAGAPSVQAGSPVQAGAPVIPVPTVTPAQAIRVQEEIGCHHPVYEDHSCPTPVCFYARIFAWCEEAQKVAIALQPSATTADNNRQEPETGTDKRLGSTTGDDNHQRSETSSDRYEFFRIHVKSALLAVFLQWGTTCAGVMAIYLTPARGIGCRSLSFLIYGSFATLIWILLFTSSVLAHYVRRPTTRGVNAAIVVLRQLAKIFAAVNTAWILLFSLFQVSNVYDNCYCNSSVIGLGRKAYTVFSFTPEEGRHVKLYWAAGMIMSSGTALLFLFSIAVLTKHSEEIEYSQ